MMMVNIVALGFSVVCSGSRSIAFIVEEIISIISVI